MISNQFTIREGGNQLGELSEVKWASCPHFLRIEIDFTDNGNFELMSIAQLLSVPYSMYANNATSATVADSTWKAAQAVFAESANNAESAAFAEQADEANFAQSALNATQANFAENATNAVNAQFATTASFAEEAANTFWRPNDQAIFYSKGTVGLLPATADFEPIFKGRLTVIGNDEQDDNIPTWLINDDSNEIFGQTGLGRILRMKKSADEDYSIGTYDWGIDNNQSLYLQTPSGKGGFTYNPNFIIDGTNRFIGIDTASPKAKLHVAEGDIYIENVGSGVIMKDNNNGCWRLTIDAIGRIQTTQLESCPEE
ncbi:MAG: hypothetical protein AAFO07_30310 [Bacteroidota bacterium]